MKRGEIVTVAVQGDYGIHYLDCPLVRRKAFPNAAAQGKGVGEYTPRDPKAIDELTTLMAFIYQNDG